MSSEPTADLPWRADNLEGFSTLQGPTYNGGWFTGGGPKSPVSLTVRVLLPMGRPATVEVDLCDEKDGRTVTLTRALAREAAAAIVAAADKADREMAHWRGVVERMRAEVAELSLRNAIGQAGLDAKPKEVA